MKNNIIYRSVQGLLILVVAAALLIAVTQVVYAVLYNISTTDSSVAEWGTQNIGVFQTDTTGESGIPASEDIVQGWVASGPSGAGSAETLYFLMELNDGTALANNMTAVAAIDCDRDGNFLEVEDILVTYTAYCTGAGDERAAAVRGDQTGDPIMLGPDAGQRVGSKIEWMINVSDLPDVNEDNCRGNVDIRFYSADNTLNCTTLPGGDATIVDEADGIPYAGWNIPSVVQLKEFEAQSTASDGSVSIIALLVAGTGGIGLGVLAWWRKR